MAKKFKRPERRAVMPCPFRMYGPPPICKWILEVAPLHSIASSARPDRGSGTVMPSGAQFQALSRFSPGSEVAEGVSGGWSRLYRLGLVSCGPTLGRLRPFAAYVMAATSTR